MVRHYYGDELGAFCWPVLAAGIAVETSFSSLMLFGLVLAGRVEIEEASFLRCVTLAQGLRVGLAWGAPGPSLL